MSRAVSQELLKSGLGLRNGDIVVVSSKFAAMAEGRFVKLSKVKPSERAEKLATKYHVDASLAQLILDESEAILGGIPGFVLAVSKGILAPNAGIDRSNVPQGYAILYPKEPQKTAERLREGLLSASSAKRLSKIGIVLSDSRITPTRLGTIGIAVAAAGFEPVLDFRGHVDLFGNVLKVTLRAQADELASAAELVMGEADESTPLVLIRGSNTKFFVKDEKENKSSSMLIPYEHCLYIQGLKNGLKN